MFANNISELSMANTPHHDVGNARLIKSMTLRVPPERGELIRKEIQQMLEADIIEPSKSNWFSPILITFKKDGSPRAVVDYGKLNSVPKPDVNDSSKYHDLFMAFRQARTSMFSTLDLRSGFLANRCR